MYVTDLKTSVSLTNQENFKSNEHQKGQSQTYKEKLGVAFQCPRLIQRAVTEFGVFLVGVAVPSDGLLPVLPEVDHAAS